MTAGDLPARLARRALRAGAGAGRGTVGLARRAWGRRPTARRGGALLLCVALAAAGLHGLAFLARLPGRLPRAVDWAAARALLERDARPGDLVAVAPPWAERAREAVPGPVPLVALPRYEGEDLPGARRVWLLSIPGAPGFSFEVELDLVRRASRSEPLPRLGALSVTRYELAFPVLPLAFLPDRLGGAAVSLGGVPCPATPGGFSCGEGAPRAERTVREVDGRPRPCIAVELPAPSGAPLELTFEGVPVGRVLRGHAGLAGRDGAARAPVRISVRIDGEEAGAAEGAGPGFAPFELSTGRFSGSLGTVTLALTWPDAAGTLCLDAVTLP